MSDKVSGCVGFLGVVGAGVSLLFDVYVFLIDDFFGALGFSIVIFIVL